MKQKPIEVILGNCKVYRDLGQDDADVKPLKALLRGLTVREAHDRTEIAAADFARVRNADLARFTLDRLVGIVNRLGSRVAVKLEVKPSPRAGHAAIA